MKGILTALILVGTLLISACDSWNIGIIGGADRPTDIVVGKNVHKIKGQFGQQLEKRPVRMFNLDGDLYYDSGLVSENTSRCGVMDGKLKRSVNENEIPINSGESNFDADGYQIATSITKEVCINDEWIIFKKYDTYGRTTDGLKYCYYIKGHLNNAVADSEIIVLSQDEDITFNDVYEPLLSSQMEAGDGIGTIFHNSINNDKWGICLFAEDVTSTGITLKIEQFGGDYSGELQTGAAYTLEKNINDEWQQVKTRTDEPLVWTLQAYIIKKNDITEMKIDWKYAYGELEPGYYRLIKEIADFKVAEKYDKETYEVYFTID